MLLGRRFSSSYRLAQPSLGDEIWASCTKERVNEITNKAPSKSLIRDLRTSAMEGDLLALWCFAHRHLRY